MSDELSRLLREAEVLAKVDGGLEEGRKLPVLLGGGLGAGGFTDFTWGFIGDVIEQLLTKLSRSKGNLLRRGVSLVLG